MKFLLSALLALYLFVLVLVWVCLYVDDGSSFLTALFLFSPRWALAFPLLILVPWTLAVRFKLAFLYALHGAILLFPILGFELPSWVPKQSADGLQLRLITCNLGEGPVDISRLVALVKENNTDLLLLQECSQSESATIFQELGWNFRRSENLVVGSSWAVNELESLREPANSRYFTVTTLAVEQDSSNVPSALDPTVHSDGNADNPSHQIQVACVHFPTFRPAFERARSFDASASRVFADLQNQYRDIVQSAWDKLHASNLPTIVAGDFNVPIQSACYRDHWREFQNCLSQCGWGFCFTKYTRLHGVRIDHVLADNHWVCRSARVGPNLGGDHRPVMVELQLR